jgi:hypothetical protein
MYAQILAAVLLIPLGLSTLMRGSDDLNRGLHGAGEGGAMALSGAGMILAGLALLLGALVAGVLALVALGTATVVWIRQRRRALGRTPRPSEMAGRAALTGCIVLLLIAGFR